MRQLCGFAVLGMFVAVPVHTPRAADASHPYSNVDHGVDAGNDTGDSQVDRLNQQQLAGSGAQGGQRYDEGAPARRYGAPQRLGGPGGYDAPPPYGVAVVPYGWHRPKWWRRHRVLVAPVYP